MKNKILNTTLILFTCFQMFEVSAQSPDWNLKGNSGTSPGTDFLGTTDAISLVIKTNSNEKMRIVNSTGFVGIGTSSPSSVLHLDATNLSTSELFRTTAPSDMANYWRMYRMVSGAPKEYGRIWTNGNNADFEIGVVDNSGDLRFNTHGVNLKMIILAGGKVGIGVAKPSNKLEVFDKAIQLKLSYDGTYSSDLFCTSAGDLQLIPNGSGTDLGGVGIGTSTPNNKLEVLKATTYQQRLSYDGTYYSQIGTNSAGDLIVTPTGHSGTTQGTLCLGTTTAGPRLNAVASTSQNGYDGIWAEAPRNAILAKCHGANLSFGSYAIQATSDNSLGDGGTVYGISTTATGAKDQNYYYNTALSSVATSINSSITVGTYTQGRGSDYSNVGLWADGNGSASYRNYGVLATASGASGSNCAGSFVVGGASGTKFGIYAEASSTTGTNYAVYGRAAINGENGGDWAAYFDGDGYLNADGWIYGSDFKIKKNITPIHDALDVIMNLHPKTFQFTNENIPNYDVPDSGLHAGLIAQDVELILPSIVHTVPINATFDSLGNVIYPATTIKGICTEELTAFLIAAIQEQNQRIQHLQSQLNDCCGSGLRTGGSGNEGISRQTAELKNSQSAFLGQSVPNPHSTQATIPYFIPATEMGDARIIFIDQLGRDVNTIDIVGRGQGQLTLMTSQLEDGIYTYSLVVNGKVIDAKKMVKSSH